MTGDPDVALWKAAAADPRVSEVLIAIFKDATEVVRRERPLCLASGRCCRFEAHGHRLYVTGLEAAWFLKQLAESRGRLLQVSEIEAARGRPFLICEECERREAVARCVACDETPRGRAARPSRRRGAARSRRRRRRGLVARTPRR